MPFGLVLTLPISSLVPNTYVPAGESHAPAATTHLQGNLTFEDEEGCPGKLIEPVFSVLLRLPRKQGMGEGVQPGRRT